MSRKPRRGGDGVYEIGYSRPPVATRFQPGVSGNPRGRPKGLKSVADIVEQALARRVRITEHGRSTTLPLIEVAIRQMAAQGARGDLKAIHALLALRDRYGDKGEAAASASDLAEEDLAILERFVTQTADSVRAGDESGRDDGGSVDDGHVE
jgi:hypothetical protein